MAGIWHRWQYNSCIVFAVVVDVVKYIEFTFTLEGINRNQICNMQQYGMHHRNYKCIEKNVMQENKTLYSTLILKFCFGRWEFRHWCDWYASTELLPHTLTTVPTWLLLAQLSADDCRGSINPSRSARSRSRSNLLIMIGWLGVSLIKRSRISCM